MTDKELLELAAKAVGIPQRVVGAEPGLYFLYKDRDGMDGAHHPWNPLTDDGDALRLAVKLNLIVECMNKQTAARTFDSRHAGCVDHSAKEVYRGRAFKADPCAASRLAIVQVAAEIGKVMQDG